MKKFISYLIFYLFQFSWGIIMNTFGILVSLFMLISLHKPHRLGPNFYFVCKKAEGFGFSLGIFAIIGKDCDADPIIMHECGHGIQNFFFGPFALLFFFIPSLFRYWYREVKYYNKGLEPKTEYDAIFFEGTATRWGEKRYINLFNKKFKNE